MEFGAWPCVADADRWVQVGLTISIQPVREFRGRKARMETRFTQFLRFGGNGEFQFKRDGKSWVATSLSIKSEFPNYQALRERFEA